MRVYCVYIYECTLHTRHYAHTHTHTHKHISCSLYTLRPIVRKFAYPEAHINSIVDTPKRMRNPLTCTPTSVATAIPANVDVDFPSMGTYIITIIIIIITAAVYDNGALMSMSLFWWLT